MEASASTVERGLQGELLQWLTVKNERIKPQWGGGNALSLKAASGNKKFLFNSDP